MDNISILMWSIGGGFAGTWAILFYMVNHFNEKFEKVDQRFEKVDQRFEKVDQQLDKVREEVKDIDRRLCRIEGALSSKDCCMLKDDRMKEKSS